MDILVISGNAANRSAAATGGLNRQRHKVEVVTTWSAAGTAVQKRKRHFDVVLADLDADDSELDDWLSMARVDGSVVAVCVHQGVEPGEDLFLNVFRKINDD